MACKLCEERGKNWVGSNPICAFESGNFSADNWNCATLLRLRDLCEDSELRNGDQAAALLCGASSDHIVLAWYKQRGRTEGAYMLLDGAATSLSLEEAELVVKKYKDGIKRR